MPQKLLLATNNRGKVIEYKEILQCLPLVFVSPSECGINVSVDETGQTYEENARIKATAMAAASGLVALADDSGLEVDALGGEPGIKSARYAGERASDADRVGYLLSKLKNVPWEKRGARFRCVIALATPPGEVKVCSGECRGIITLEPKGEQGFGYDPVFYFPELDKTMAELPAEIKNKISHRARAAQKVPAILKSPPFASFLFPEKGA